MRSNRDWFRLVEGNASRRDAVSSEISDFFSRSFRYYIAKIAKIAMYKS